MVERLSFQASQISTGVQFSILTLDSSFLLTWTLRSKLLGSHFPHWEDTIEFAAPGKPGPTLAIGHICDMKQWMGVFTLFLSVFLPPSLK